MQISLSPINQTSTMSKHTAASANVRNKPSFGSDERSANKEVINWGILGTGKMAGQMFEAFKYVENAKVQAVASRNEDTVKQFAEDRKIPKYYVGSEKLAKAKGIDVVYIATPVASHYQNILDCLNNGKHVLCEKPFASNAKEVKEMIDTAKRHNKVLMEAMMPTLLPNFEQVRQQMDKIGIIHSYFASYCQYSSRYDMFKAGEILNAFKAGMSNGALMDIGVYTIYPMVILFGKPIRINALGKLLSTGVDGQGMIQFEYPSMLATVVYSKIFESPLPTAIHGEDATIVIDHINCIKSVTLNNRKNKTTEDLSIQPLHHEYYYEIAEFINTIQSDKKESTINSLQHSLWTMEIMDEVRRQVKNR